MGKQIIWVAKQDGNGYNRGAGVGYSVGKAGQRLYVGYTVSCPLGRVNKTQAIRILIAIANGWTGWFTMAELPRL